MFSALLSNAILIAYSYIYFVRVNTVMQLTFVQLSINAMINAMDWFF